MLSGCSTEPSALYRSTGDANPPSMEVLYISPFLALVKSKSDQTPPDSPKSYYSLCFAHWLNDPESATGTGDIFDKDLVTSISLIGQSKSDGLLFGQGNNPGTNNWQNLYLSDPPFGDITSIRKTPENGAGFFIITQDRVMFFLTRKEMDDCLKDVWNISRTRIDPSDVFFESARRRSNQPNLGVFGQTYTQ